MSIYINDNNGSKIEVKQIYIKNDDSIIDVERQYIKDGDSNKLVFQKRKFDNTIWTVYDRKIDADNSFYLCNVGSTTIGNKLNFDNTVSGNNSYQQLRASVWWYSDFKVKKGDSYRITYNINFNGKIPQTSSLYGFKIGLATTPIYGDLDSSTVVSISDFDIQEGTTNLNGNTVISIPNNSNIDGHYLNLFIRIEFNQGTDSTTKILAVSNIDEIIIDLI